jgi:hypothetical protein
MTITEGELSLMPRENILSILKLRNYFTCICVKDRKKKPISRLFTTMVALSNFFVFFYIHQQHTALSSHFLSFVFSQWSNTNVSASSKSQEISPSFASLS